MPLPQMSQRQFTKYRRAGLTLVEIASKVGASVNELDRWVDTNCSVKATSQSTLVLNRRYAELKSKGLSDVSVGLVLGFDHSTVARWKLLNNIPKHRHRASLAEQYKVLTSYKIPDAAIAKAFKISVEQLGHFEAADRALPIKNKLAGLTVTKYFELKTQHKTDAKVAGALCVRDGALAQWKKRNDITKRQVAPPMPAPMPRLTAKLVTQYWPLIAKQREELQAFATDKLIRCCWIIEWRRSIGSPIEKEEKYISRSLHFAKGDMYKARLKIKHEISLHNL
jgi:transcriptional regulator with XRE-family HTH domain